MQFSPNIFNSNFPGEFAKFQDCFDKDLWYRRDRQIAAAIRGNQYLDEWLRRENRITLALARYSRHQERTGALPTVNILNDGEYEIVAFVTQCMAFLKASNTTAATQFLRRAKACFSNPDDMRGLTLELAIAVHFQRQGILVRPPTDGTYDWLAKNDKLEFEVECKSVSVDKGRKVHHRDALDVSQLIRKEIKAIIAPVKVGLLIKIQVPGRLSSDYQKK